MQKNHEVFVWWGVLTVVLSASLFCSCVKKQTGVERERVGTQYAQYFTIEERDTVVREAELPGSEPVEKRYTFTELCIYNPWEADKPVLQRYYLYKESESAKLSKNSKKRMPLPADGTAIRVPVRRVATGSCTHVGFLSALDALDVLCGVTDKHLVYTELGADVVNLGDCISPDAERFVAVQPEVVFMSTYGTNDAATTRLQKAGLTVIPVMEWVENDPLGRAEWVRMFGAFLGLDARADSVFACAADNYHRMSALVEESGEAFSRSILSGGSFRGTWYVPSGATYMGRLFKDAGAQYAYAENQTNGSVPLSIEQVLQAFREADVWVGAPAGTLHELEEMDSKHTWFKAYENHSVYTFKARTTPTGGNDFWEAGVTEPDRILSDLVYVLYPSLLPEYAPKYLQQLR